MSCLILSLKPGLQGFSEVSQSSLFSKHFAQYWDNRWQILLHCPPDYFHICSKIFMHELIAHACDLTPGNCWSRITHMFRNLACGLTDDFQRPHYRIFTLFIFKELVVFLTVDKVNANSAFSNI